MRPGASPQSRGYIYTGPREVSSLVTDLPGTPVTPRIYIYIQKVIEVLHLYRCVTHTYQGVCNHVGSFNEGTTSFPGNSNPLIWLDAQHSFTYPFWSFNRPCVAPAHLKAPAPHRARETAHHETPAAWGFNAAISACDKGGAVHLRPATAGFDERSRRGPWRPTPQDTNQAHQTSLDAMSR